MLHIIRSLKMCRVDAFCAMIYTDISAGNGVMRRNRKIYKFGPYGKCPCGLVFYKNLNPLKKLYEKNNRLANKRLTPCSDTVK